MKKTLAIIFMAVIHLSVWHQPAPAIGETLHFDADGLAVNEKQYDKDTAAREKATSMELTDGYNAGFAQWKDPIKIRKKRIAQWEEMRLQYDPDSLPHKIADPKDR